MGFNSGFKGLMLKTQHTFIWTVLDFRQCSESCQNSLSRNSKALWI